MSKLYAVPHDGTMNGDSSYYTTFIPMPKPGDGRSLRQVIIDGLVKDTDEELRTEYESSLDGAWIVDENVKKAVDAMYGDLDFCNDSMSYTLNRAAKNICKNMAERNVDL
jgi:hypothetical protein